MRDLHARYPFLRAAREAVQAAGVDLAELVRERGPAVQRGRERVERALVEGTVEPEGRPPGTRAELLSYPVARVLVSLVDVPGAVEKYAQAEAAVAEHRFVEDIEHDGGLKSDRTPRVTLRQLLADFDLADDVTPVLAEGSGPDAGEVPTRYDVAVTAYLLLAAEVEGEKWRLPHRALAGGRVPVDRRELHVLLREAVRRRVAEGLPLDVPDAVADALSPEVEELRDALADVDPPRSFDVVDAGAFPPCVDALVDRARGAEEWTDLPAHSRFALVAFLASLGLDAEEVATVCGIGRGREALGYQHRRLTDERGAQFAPPSCATMQALGDCVNPDDLCATIDHPLAYYGARLDADDGANGERDTGAEGD